MAGAALALAVGCGSGGGGGGTFAVKSTIFGFNPFTGSFEASGQQGEAPLIPLNMCVVFDFTSPIRPDTATAASIVVQELDTSVTPPAPGPIAAATFQVNGSRLTICPLITFTDTNATFGWGDPNTEKTYQILFQVSPSPSVLTSTSGRKLSTSDRGPYLFRTSRQIFDQKSGPPIPSLVRLLDPTSGAELGRWTVATGTDASGNPILILNPATPLTNIPTTPVPELEITFNEPVVPSSAVDPGGVGTSQAIHIELDRDGNVATSGAGDRVLIPGTYALSETSIDATVRWTSLLSELPTDASSGCLYVVRMDGDILDLSGNDLVSTFGQFQYPTLQFQTAPGASTSPVDPVTEPFDDQTNNDLTVTSANWGQAFAGFLTPGLGGGTGADGLFDPNNPTFQAFPPPGVTVNVPGKLVTMSTGGGVQRQYEFTTFRLPAGWRVVATESFPLNIQCTGSATFTGILDISGAPGAVYVNGSVVPGAAGAGKVGGASGGRGGATTDSGGVDTFFPNQGGAPVSYGKLAFASSSTASQGLSGRSTALDTAAFTLTDSNFAANLNALNVANLWIQPNTGADDYRFERYHPAFKVESIASGVVTVVSDPADPNYRGELSQETLNPWLEDDGDGGLRAPLLAEQFDSYVIGELNGFPGGDLFDLDLDGAADDPVKVGGGQGSECQAVMQTFLTLGRSGGGGGGGNAAAGENGADDPTVANGPGSFGGTGFVGGAGGARAPTATLLQRVDSDTLRVSTPLFDDGSGNPDGTFVGHLVNPNVLQGNTFTIVSVDAVDTVTIREITTAGGLTINLNTTVMAPGNTVRVTPPYEAGGTGGGGAGVHCAGSSKTPANHTGHPGLSDPRNQNGATNTAGFYDDDGGIAPPNQIQDGLEDTNPSGEAIFTLSKWVPGGGGGAGGGALRFIAAGNVDVGAAGGILAQGGEGGRSDLPGVNSASGGGGGSGGTIFLGSGGSITVALGGRISCAGGLGGAQGFGIEGGDGSPGRIRLENKDGNLKVADFTGVGDPAITAEHLGVFPGGGQSVAQSLFLAIGALNPQYQQLVVNYTANQNGAPITATYIVLRDGSVDPASTLAVPPFEVLLSAAPADPATGFADEASATAFADPTVTPPQTYDGKPYVRFKLILTDTSTPVVIGGDSFTSVRIDDITINADSVKP